MCRFVTRGRTTGPGQRPVPGASATPRLKGRHLRGPSSGPGAGRSRRSPHRGRSPASRSRSTGSVVCGHESHASRTNASPGVVGPGGIRAEDRGVIGRFRQPAIQAPGRNDFPAPPDPLNQPGRCPPSALSPSRTAVSVICPVRLVPGQPFRPWPGVSPGEPTGLPGSAGALAREKTAPAPIRGSRKPPPWDPSTVGAVGQPLL